MAPIDLTRVLDPAELWPDPESCPDWPLANGHGDGNFMPPQQRLEFLYVTLNRTREPVKAPTVEEAAQARDQHFRPNVGPAENWRWAALGITDLKPAMPSSETAYLIVEAAHIRGHRRKHDARAEGQAAQEREAQTRRLRRKLDDFPAAQERLLAELQDVRVGAQRHAQREADEKAHNRWQEAARALNGIQQEVTATAAALGVDTPAFKPVPQIPSA